MKNYIYTYHSNQTTQPAPEALTAWNSWFDTLGDALIDGGNPITGQKMLLKDGTIEKDSNDLIGYSIVKANSIDEAVEMAKNNPLANAPGCAVRVYETGQM